MDYKFLVLMLLLVVLIGLMYKEVSSFKKDIMYRMVNFITDIEKNNDETVAELQDSMVKCVSQVKKISSDNIQQLRKITVLNSQPIIRTANHFTETDCSDIVSEQLIKKEGNSIYYMSEDSVSSHYSDKKIVEDIPMYVSKKDKSCDDCLIVQDKSSDNSFEYVDDESQLEESVQKSVDENVPMLEGDSEQKSVDKNIDLSEENSKKSDTSFKDSLSETVDTDVSNNLLSIDKYTVTQLKEFSKKHNLPTTYKDNGRWRCYNKKQLYSSLQKIKSVQTV